MAKLLSSKSKKLSRQPPLAFAKRVKINFEERYARNKQMPGDKLEMTAMLNVLRKDVSDQRVPDVGKLQTDEGK